MRLGYCKVHFDLVLLDNENTNNNNSKANRGLTELGAVFKESFAPFYFKALELFMIAITPTPKTTILRELLQLQNSVRNLSITIYATLVNGYPYYNSYYAP